MVQKVEKFIKTDRRLKLHVVAKEMAISKDSARKIIVDQLGMRKISARWVPRLLTPFDKQRRVQFSQENMDFMEGEKKFFSMVVTGDETLCFYYDPGTKEQSKQ